MELDTVRLIALCLIGVFVVLLTGMLVAEDTPLRVTTQASTTTASSATIPVPARTVSTVYLAAPTRSPTTHDYGPGKRDWGHDYTFEPITQDGRVARIMGWGRGISVGDYLLIEQKGSPDGRTRYLVDDIAYFRDPSDMWSARATFAPRLA